MIDWYYFSIDYHISQEFYNIRDVSFQQNIHDDYLQKNGTSDWQKVNSHSFCHIIFTDQDFFFKDMRLRETGHPLNQRGKIIIKIAASRTYGREDDVDFWEIKTIWISE